ncbi:cuticle protein 10.9 isoform X1 [Rhipicephalus sanguineus]|uniref:cuticle protein 10.9 isoform X1 n=1 Tax=Rhipicephalus sanguineus TaxID=34632 RepID=UPI0020C1C9AA|nr:cuticle protein 10.9 isoform X1 [Rhipicephalus sanguineus]
MCSAAALLAQALALCVVSMAAAGGQFGFGGLGGGYGGGLSGAFGPSFAATFARQEQYYPPQPYSFGYDNQDQYGTKSYHKEQGDASNTKTGMYGYSDANGIYRQVKYIADAGGFRAKIDTNEPGTAPGASADAVYNANPLPAGRQYRIIGGSSPLSSPYTSASTYGLGYGRPWSG